MARDRPSVAVAGSQKEVRENIRRLNSRQSGHSGKPDHAGKLPLAADVRDFLHAAAWASTLAVHHYSAFGNMA